MGGRGGYCFHATKNETSRRHDIPGYAAAALCSVLPAWSTSDSPLRSVSRVRSDKFYEYPAAGVREYWIIDPRPGKERADFWVLDEDGRYRPVPIDEDGIYHSTVLSGFQLRPAWLWHEELPDPLRTFAEIVGPSEVTEALQDMTEQEN